MRQEPYNLQVRHNFFKHSKDLKRMIKRKKYLFKKDLFDKLLNWKETDPKQYWQLLNSLQKSDNENINYVNSLNYDQLSDHFQSQGKPVSYNKTFSKSVDDHIENYQNILVENEITDKPFTIKEIKTCIKKLKLGKSAGPDLISNEIIKYSSTVTCKSITKLFNLILDTGNYPNEWRKSFTVVIYKSGDSSNLNI